MTTKPEKSEERQDWIHLEKSGYLELVCIATEQTELHPGDSLPFQYRGLSLSMEIDENTVLPQTQYAKGEELCVVGLVNDERCVAQAAVPRPYYDRFRSFPSAEEKAEAIRRFSFLPEPVQEKLTARLNGERYPIARLAENQGEKIEDLRFRFQLCRDTYTQQQQLDIETIFRECGSSEYKREMKAECRLRYILGIDQSSAKDFRLSKEEIIEALDERLYRLDAVKEKIAEAIVAAKYANRKGFAILLVGSPGVGKTSIIRAVAEVLGRPYFTVSLGSSSSLLDLIGDAPHYESADCGLVVKNFYKIGTTEAVVGLDEFDKPYRSDKEGGGKSTKVFNDALSDEHMFRDVFLGTGINTKNTLFIATANSTETIAENLLNRFVVIHIPDYTEEEKAEIARRHILPELFREYGIGEREIVFEKDVLLYIARHYCEDEGARDMKKHLRSLVDHILAFWDSACVRPKFTVTREFVEASLASGVNEDSPVIVFRRNRGKYSDETAAEIRSLIGKCRCDDLSSQEREQYTKRLSYLTRLIPSGEAFRTFDVDAFYSEREKEEILGSYIIPRVTAEYCPRELDVRFPQETQSLLLSSYCQSMGVRDADRAVRRLVCEKLFSLRGGTADSALVTPEDVERVLGSPPPQRGNFPDTIYPGLTRALAVTEDGCGMTFSVETILLPGEDTLTLTGLPKASTVDSVRLAVSFIKRRWPGALRSKGIHVHFGEGSVEKDGPSAGVAILISLLSAVFGENVDGSATYTGEINGNGCVFCIGGTRAKIRAAEQAGCTRVFLPYDNYRELTEKELSELRIKVIPVRHVDEVIREVLPRLEEKTLETCAEPSACNA